MPLFQPLEQTYVVTGPRETWLVKCREALERSSSFSEVSASESLFQVTARYKQYLLPGMVLVLLLPEGADSTRIIARATVFPTFPFALLTGVEHRILAEFGRALS